MRDGYILYMYMLCCFALLFVSPCLLLSFFLFISHLKTCTCCVALPCCLFHLACFFLPSFSPLITCTCMCRSMYIYTFVQCQTVCALWPSSPTAASSYGRAGGQPQPRNGLTTGLCKAVPEQSHRQTQCYGLPVWRSVAGGGRTN